MNIRYFICAALYLVCGTIGAQAQTTDSSAAPRQPATNNRASTLVSGELTAYGTIYSSGVKYSGTPNFSVTYNSQLKRYEITILNEDYYYLHYTTLVTPASSGIICSSSSYMSKLVVQCTNLAGTNIAASFAFETRKY